MKKWQEEWNTSEKGGELFKYCPVVSDKNDEQMELQRSDFRLIARLQNGHVELNKHLNRINVKHSPNCEFCRLRKQESVTHYLKKCPAFEVQRRTMKTKLKDMRRIVDHSQQSLCRMNKVLCRNQIPEVLEIALEFIKSTNRFIFFFF